MSKVGFRNEITLGSVIQLLLLAGTLFAFHREMTTDISVNKEAIQNHDKAIEANYQLVNQVKNELRQEAREREQRWLIHIQEIKGDIKWLIQQNQAEALRNGHKRD